jgi:signal transduction histidine kinase
MSTPSSPRPPTAFQFQGNHGMLLAISCLSLLATWAVTQRLAAQGETIRLVLFLIGSVGYFLSTSGIFDQLIQRHGLLPYFLLQFFLLGLMLYSSPPGGPVWLLTLPLASQAVLSLSSPAMWPTLGLVFIAASLPLLELRGAQIFYGALNIFSSFFFTVGCSWAIRREQETRVQLEAAHEKLRIYAQNIEALAGAEERNRLAGEIHDGVAHHLTAANVLLEAGQALLAPDVPPATRDPLSKAQAQIRAALVELRESIATRDPRSTELPLPERIRSLIAEGNFSAELNTAGNYRQLSPAAEQAFFRVAQEALTNARKHAPGTHAALRLDYTRNGLTTLRVENPEIPHAESSDGAFGLLSLRERVQQLGGTFSAGSEPAGRFVVHAEVPA